MRTTHPYPGLAKTRRTALPSRTSTVIRQTTLSNGSMKGLSLPGKDQETLALTVLSSARRSFTIKARTSTCSGCISIAPTTETRRLVWPPEAVFADNIPIREASGRLGLNLGIRESMLTMTAKDTY